MNIEFFARELPDHYYDWGTPKARLKDDRFEREIHGVWNMTVSNAAQVLNCACRHLEAGEVYLEAGVLHGASMRVALLHNPDMHGIGIDDWSEFPSNGGNLSHAEKNLKQYIEQGRVELRGIDIKIYLLCKHDPRVRIGVYYYDANHDYFETLCGLELSILLLANNAVIVLDDTSWTGPRRAIDEFLSRNAKFGFSMLLDLEGKRDGNSMWGRGLSVIQYKRNEEGWKTA